MLSERDIRLPIERPALLLSLALAALFLVACASKKAPAAKRVEPLLLAALALAPADLGGAYVIDQDQYLDEDGNISQQPTHDFQRQMHSTGATPAAGAAESATAILITVDEPGVEKAQEFFDATDDEGVGPPNLADLIQRRLPGSHNIHVELLPDFPVYGDDTIANRLTWQQFVDGREQTEDAYGVYVRAGGRLALVALRAPAAADGGEPESLYRQTEAAVKRQSEKLKSQGPSQIGPR